MHERKHSVLIGAFVVGSLIILLAAGLFFGGAGFGGKRDKIIMVFEGSVKGLTVGAPVALRGVQVGQVTDIQLVLSTEDAGITMLVEAEIAGKNVQVATTNREDLLSFLIMNGLRAQLNMQSVLTGLLYIQMDFHPDKPANMADIKSPYTQVPTIPTELEILRRTLQSVDYADIADSLQTITRGLRDFVQNDDFRALPGTIQQALASMERAGNRVDESIARLEPGLEQLLTETSGAASSLRDAVPRIAADTSTALEGLDAALADTRRAMGSLGDRVDANSPTMHRLNETLRDLARASRALEGLVHTLEDQPDALLRGRREDTP